jgi:hypothetical protein
MAHLFCCGDRRRPQRRRLGGLIEHDFAIAFGERGQTRCKFGLSHGAPEPTVSGIVRVGHAAELRRNVQRRKTDPRQKNKVSVLLFALIASM